MGSEIFATLSKSLCDSISGEFSIHSSQSSKPKYPQTVPTYTEDYGPKPLVKRETVHYGAASENYRNNPHPREVSHIGHAHHDM